VRAKQVLLRVGGWEDVTVGNDARGEMLPNKAIRPSKDKKVPGVIKQRKNLCQVKTL
jgi:hypothetical protein